MNLGQIADWHLERGFHVVPTHGKRALTRWGPEHREYLAPGDSATQNFAVSYTYRDRITGETVQTRPDGIGAILKPSNMVVLDLDGEEAIQWARQMAKRAPEMARAPRVRSPRDGGGIHLWFVQRAGRERLKQSHGGLAPGVDLKADGSLVVLPGSLHKSGKRYRIDSDKRNFDIGNMPEAPEFIYDWQDQQDAAKTQWDGKTTNFDGMSGTIFAQHVEVFSGNDRKAHIRCPNWQNHSKGDVSGTVLYPAKDHGGLGKIHCEHAACHGLTSKDYKRMIGDELCNQTEKEIKNGR